MLKRLCIITMAGCLLAGPALAKELHLQAWGQGEQLCAEATSLDQTPIFTGDILVQNALGEELARGITDETGLWCYTPDKVEDFKVSVTDPEGNKASASIDKKQFAAGLSNMHLNGVSAAQLRAMIREEVSLQLRPLQQSLRPDDRPGVLQIAGGLGWIIGIGALGSMWHRSRSRKK